MPHLILEYTDNLIEQDSFETLFQSCHSILEKTLPTNKGNCKSRALMLTSYCAGDGDANNAFVHVSLKIMPGRTRETLNQVAAELMSLFNAHFSQSRERRALQVSLEIMALQETYFK